MNLKSPMLIKVLLLFLPKGSFFFFAPFFQCRPHTSVEFAQDVHGHPSSAVVRARACVRVTRPAARPSADFWDSLGFLPTATHSELAVKNKTAHSLYDQKTLIRSNHQKPEETNLTEEEKSY